MARTTGNLQLFVLFTLFTLCISTSGTSAIPLATSLRRQATYLYETSSALYSSSSEALSAQATTLLNAANASRLRIMQAAAEAPTTLSRSMHQAAATARTAFGLVSSVDDLNLVEECGDELCAAHH